MFSGDFVDLIVSGISEEILKWSLFLQSMSFSSTSHEHFVLIFYNLGRLSIHDDYPGK